MQCRAPVLMMNKDGCLCAMEIWLERNTQYGGLQACYVEADMLLERSLDVQFILQICSK